MRNNSWYETNKNTILQLYYDDMSIQDICKNLLCNKPVLYKKFNEWKIKRRNKIKLKERCNAKYYIDAEYFDTIDNEHKAYWLGFILADGFVNEKEISFCLQKRDENMIRKFVQDLKSTHKIKYNKDDNPYVCIVCKHICDSLLNKGFHNRKSWSIDFEKIISFVPKELQNHFIRGMFDGDGCIKYYKYDYRKLPQFHFGYTGVKNTCEYLQSLFDIKRKMVFDGNKTYTLVTRDKNKILEIYDYLYKDATIYMDRKFETFNTIKMMTFNDYNKAIL